MKFDHLSQKIYNKSKIPIGKKIYADSNWRSLRCKKVKAALIRALVRFKKPPNQGNNIKQKTWQKNYFYKLKEKRKSWQDMCENINADITPTELWNTG